MEFIKLREDRYMIKGSNNVVVSEEEKLKLEKKELIIEDIESSGCQGTTTIKIREINEKLNGRKNSKPKTIEEAESVIE